MHGYVHAKSLQSCPTLCNPMDHSPPGSSVHGVIQARILEWAAVPFSKGSSDPGIDLSLTCLLLWQVGSLPVAPPGKLCMYIPQLFYFYLFTF